MLILITSNISWLLECQSFVILTQFYSSQVMQLSDSRSTSAAKEQFKSTRGSFFIKATGRDVRPAWSNRIVKDFNDLDYDVERNRFSSINKFKNTDILKKQKIQADLRKKRASKKRVGPERNELYSPTNRKESLRKGLSALVGVLNPERIEMSTSQTLDSKYYGLCPFQYVNTIEGKMKKRSNHHLSFQKSKVQRSINQIPIYYNRHEDIDFSYSQLMSQRKELKKYHLFSSSPERKTFEPKDELDKFYDEDHCRRLASPRRQREAVMEFEKITGRKEPKYNQSVGLSFDTVPCIARLQRKSQNYSIPVSQREIIFSPQIIDPKRGCYR